MPEAQPAAAVSPEQANSERRSAIESQSAKALRVAIETVSEDAPVPAPAPEPKPEEPDEPEVETEPAQAAEPPKPATASEKLEKSARRAMRARRDAQAAADANQRAIAAEQQAASAREEAKAARELLDLLKADPMGALAKVGHDPARLVPDWLKKVAEPEKTPEQKALEELQKKNADLEAWQKQQELAQRNQSLTAQIATYQGTCAEAIADKDAFEYVHRDGGTEALYRYITDTYELAVTEAKAGRLTAAEAKTGRYSEAQLVEMAKQKLAKIAATPPALFAKQMEAELRGKFGTAKVAPAAAATPGKPATSASLLDAARNTHSSKTLKQRQKAKPAAEEDDEPRSPRGGGVRTVAFKKPFKQADLIANAIRAMTDAGGRR